MIFIKLDSLHTVSHLCNICEKYKDNMDIDVKYSRYTMNGTSLLAVTSLMGNIVKIVPITKDNLLINYFIKDVKEIGAWTREEEVEDERY